MFKQLAAQGGRIILLLRHVKRGNGEGDIITK